MALATSIFRVELPLKWSQQARHHKVVIDNSLHGVHILEAWLLHLFCLCRKCVVTVFFFWSFMENTLDASRSIE
jgi:hypothetical protein